MRNIRFEKLESVLLREISNVILAKMQDARIKLATITKVNISKDLKFVKVYFSYLGDKSEIPTIQKILNRSSGFIRNQIKGCLRMKHIPTLSFRFDDSIEKAIRMSRVLDKISQEIKRGEELNGEE